MTCLSPALFVLLVMTAPTLALAQGGHLGEGAPDGTFIKVLLGLVVGLGVLITVALLLVRPQRDPPASLTGPAVGGMALSIPIVALSVFMLLWLESLAAGAVVALGLAAGYVALMARRWRR